MRAATDAHREQRKQPDEDDWGDVKGRRTRAVRDMQHCCRLIDERCGVRVAFEEFQNLSESIPLLLAPAALTWSTFERTQRGALWRSRSPALTPTRRDRPWPGLPRAVRRHAVARPRQLRASEAESRARRPR